MEVGFRLSGTVETFDASAFRAAMLTRFPRAAELTLTVTAGSVNVAVKMVMESPAAATAAVQLVQTTPPAQMQSTWFDSMPGLVVEAAPTATMTLRLVEAPTPPPPQPSSPPAPPKRPPAAPPVDETMRQLLQGLQVSGYVVGGVVALLLLWICLKRTGTAISDCARSHKEAAVRRRQRADERWRQKVMRPPPLAERHIGHGPPVPRRSRIEMEQTIESAGEAQLERLVPGTFENRASRLAAGRYPSINSEGGTAGAAGAAGAAGTSSAAGAKPPVRPTTSRRPSGSSQRVLPHRLPPLGPTGGDARLPTSLDVEERLRILDESVRQSATLLRTPTAGDDRPVVNPYALSALQVRQTLQMRASSRMTAAPPPVYRISPSTTAMTEPSAPPATAGDNPPDT